jgi:flavin reductase (DIM6/NTAB) family NADH-FMN oxidoreductase RutF
MKMIDPRELELSPVRQLLDDWMLLSTGDYSAGAAAINAMTVAWGFVGAMWRRPVAITPVRPTHYTYELMERTDTWTLTAFPDAYREALQVLGSRSGRNTDKLTESGLTPIAADTVAAPSYAEATLCIECRTIYYNDIVPARMLDRSLDDHYENDYHRMYYGEILAVQISE